MYDFSQNLAAIGIIAEQYLEGGNLELEQSTDHWKNRKTTLTIDTLNEIFKIYCSKNVNLENLWNLFLIENGELENNYGTWIGSFSEWEPVGRSLLPREKNLTQPLTTCASKMSKYNLTDEESGRITTFSTTKVSSEHCNSSVVCLNPMSALSEMKFGKILQIFQHQWQNKPTVFCKINIIDTTYDPSVGLWFASINDNERIDEHQELREISSLSMPLINAEDEGFLWILH